MFIQARLPPLLPGLLREHHPLRPIATCMPIRVAVKRHVLRPVPVQQRPMFPADEVALERETQMILQPRPLDLPIPPESENVVPNVVVRAVMLMKSAVRRSIHQIVLSQYL